MQTNYEDNAEHAAVSRLEIQRGLGRVEGKLDYLVQFMEEHAKDDSRRFKDITDNLDSVQKKVWYATGFGAALGFLLSHLPIKSFLG